MNTQSINLDHTSFDSLNAVESVQTCLTVKLRTGAFLVHGLRHAMAVFSQSNWQLIDQSDLEAFCLLLAQEAVKGRIDGRVIDRNSFKDLVKTSLTAALIGTKFAGWTMNAGLDTVSDPGSKGKGDIVKRDSRIEKTGTGRQKTLYRVAWVSATKPVKPSLDPLDSLDMPEDIGCTITENAQNPLDSAMIHGTAGQAAPPDPRGVEQAKRWEWSRKHRLQFVDMMEYGQVIWNENKALKQQIEQLSRELALANAARSTATKPRAKAKA